MDICLNINFSGKSKDKHIQFSNYIKVPKSSDTIQNKKLKEMLLMKHVF
jgi:hypothetical protein